MCLKSKNCSKENLLTELKFESEEAKQKSSQEHRSESENTSKSKSEDVNSKSENAKRKGNSQLPESSQRDESFTEALNRRDRPKTKRDTGDGFHEAADAEGQAEKKPKTEIDGAKREAKQTAREIISAGFDEEEADPLEEPSEDEFGGSELAQHEDPPEAVEVPAIRRRLSTKTHPSQAPAYPARELLKLNEYRIRKFNFMKVRRKRDLEIKEARRKAIELMSRQPPIGASADEDWAAEGPIIHPSASH